MSKKIATRLSTLMATPTLRMIAQRANPVTPKPSMAERERARKLSGSEQSREHFATYQRAQERAVAYTVLAHKSLLTR
jgi:hypothetical protein